MRNLNLPNLLSNGLIIGNFAQINSLTKPTTRINGSSLVVGDKWYNTTDYTDWWWNGTYFLGQKNSIGFGAFNSRVDPFVNSQFTFPANFGLYFHSCSYAYLIGAVNDASNYYTVTPRIQYTTPPNSGSTISLTTFSTSGETPNTFYRVTNTLNSAYPYSGSVILWTTTNTTLTTVGSPQVSGHARFTFEYSLIAP